MDYLKSFNSRYHPIYETNNFDQWIDGDIENMINKIGTEANGGVILGKVKLETAFRKRKDGSWLLEFSSDDYFCFFDHQIPILVDIAKYMAEKNFELCVVETYEGFHYLEIYSVPDMKLFVDCVSGFPHGGLRIEFYKNYEHLQK